ncbi:MAG: uroporphyrinogen decarboxylase [Chitinophagales bacterium]|nr:uroporphyrinogen decarboxylase [Chitinophagales bacterium]
MLKNDLVLRAAKGEFVERTPVWVMRQAGRILPEYRAVRAQVKDFKALVKHPELVCEVTLQPVDILGVDAAIIFSDILVIPEAMGLNYEMVEAKGPLFPNTIKTEQDIDALRIDNMEEALDYVVQSIHLTKRALNDRVPLIGFAGAPWTIFAYMIEGKGSKTFSEPKKFLYTQPEWSQKLLQKITIATISYLKAQIKAGADMVQVFDSWAGILSYDLYKKFALPCIQQICDAITEVPVIVFAKDAHFMLGDFKNTSADVIGLDWTMDIQAARNLYGETKTLQGNADPCMLYADLPTIRKETTKMLQAFGSQRHIANLGHGVYPDISADHVKCLIETVQTYKW